MTRKLQGKTMSKVTIKDIARIAGVSVAAVSFAFNDPGRLSQDTVERIHKIAEELGYAPDPVARSMTSGRTSTLGVLVPNPFPDMFSNQFLSEFLEGVGEVCAAEDFSLMIVPPREGSINRAIINAAVDGFVTLGVAPFKTVMVALRQRGVPFVMVDTDPIDDAPTVNVDDEGGAYKGMCHVLKAGHRNVAILGIRSEVRGRYEKYVGTLSRRIRGYVKALSEFNLELDGNQVRLVECTCTPKGGGRGFRHVWKAIRRPTAIVAMSDSIAIGAIDAARKLNVRIPEELSVVGFDDIPLAAWVSPPLTTINQPIRRKGKVAAEMLVKYIEGELETTHHVFRTRLIVRESVCPPPRKDKI